MDILGINCFLHDASAALLSNGIPIAAAEEERFTRIKHDGSFPDNAIKFCLKQTEKNITDLDYIGFYMRPWLKFRKMILKHSLLNFPKSFYFLAGQGAANLRMLALPYYLKQKIGYYKNKTKPKIVFIEHHLAHAASTFYPSGFSESAILSIDGAGEWASALLAYAKDNSIKKIKEINFPHSLGFLYGAVTKYLGFKPNSDEYKVMGLASYGKPKYYDDFKDIVIFKKQGDFKIDLSYFTYQFDLDGEMISAKFVNKFGPPRVEGENIEERHADIASSLQKILEDTVKHILSYLFKVTNCKNLCIAGGVGLNSVMNGKLLTESDFSNIFIQPAAYDAGTSLGSALYIYHSILNKPREYVMKHIYLGSEYNEENYKEVLEECKIKYEHHQDIEAVTAKLLSENKIIGWFQGKMEFGPRALGNRSILANPMNPEMKNLVNKMVKKREEFRPFAPSVLIDKTDDYFEFKGSSPFMILVVKVKEGKRKIIPAVTHFDGTARIHTVEREVNPRYYRLIEEFEKITGVPVILNTSFNIRGEPIVHKPEDALRCFFSNGLDALVLGNYLIKK